MPLYVILRIGTQDIELAKQDDLDCPPCNFELPAYNDMALILRAPDTNGQFPPLRPFGLVRICARALTMAPFGNATKEEFARLNPQEAELQSLLSQSTNERMKELVEAAIDNDYDAPLLNGPCFSVELDEKYPGNRGVMQSNYVPETLVDEKNGEWPIYANWSASVSSSASRSNIASAMVAGTAPGPICRCGERHPVRTFVATPPENVQRPTALLPPPVDSGYAAPPPTLADSDSGSLSSGGASRTARSAPPAMTSRSYYSWSGSE